MPKSSSTNARDGDLLSRVLHTAIQPVDNASVVFFRIAFGLMMAWWAWDYLASGRVTALYVAPEVHFSYYGFEWLKPWDGNGMYYHFLALVVFALMIAFGLFYRLATVGFAIGFTCFFLFERTNYQNHYYLITLFSWLLVCLPLNRNVAIDCWRSPKMIAQTVPAWVLWAIQLHVAIPYFFGGVAKLTPDWMVGQPMGKMLAMQAEFPVLGPWLAWGPTTVLFAWFGILFDLMIVPALLWKPTRAIAFVLALAFHLSNSVLFSIHVFPWFMIVASTIFFDPSWPRRLLMNGQTPTSIVTGNKKAAVPQWQWTSLRRVSVSLIGMYLLFHAFWPLRHNLYGGETSWNERGHLFAWRMMLRGKEVGIGYAMRDPVTKQVTNVNHKQFMAEEQAAKFARDPEMILQFAKFLADKAERQGGKRPEVYALALTSLNGRKPQLIIDPNTNLAAESRGIYFSRPWVLPLTEPLRNPTWDVPVEQWSRYVEIPKLNFLEDVDSTSASSTLTSSENKIPARSASE